MSKNRLRNPNWPLPPSDPEPTSPILPDQIMELSTFAARLHVNTRTLHCLAKRGVLPCHRIYNRTTVNFQDALAALRRNLGGGAAPMCQAR